MRELVDVKEVKKQIIYAVPMIFVNMFYNLIPIVSVMFAGHLGELQLAGSTLANSWATVTGFGFMVGLSGALETLCGQKFGAKVYRMLGIYLQASCVVSFMFSIFISILWWFTEPILKLIHQDPRISKEAAIYIKFLIPGLFAYGLLQNLLRFTQTQSVVCPIVMLALVPLVLHGGLTYLLVYHTPLAYKGAALASSITFWISVIFLIIYVRFTKKFERTWKGLTMETFSHIFTDLKLALPSAAMVCLEYWAFEILVLLAGIMPNKEATTSLVAMCANTESTAFMVTYGLSAAASTRVSNALGAGKVNKAKMAMGVSLMLSFLLGTLVLLSIGFGHKIWAKFFSDDPIIIKAYSSMTPLLCATLFLDSIQGILSGVCRGCGWQKLAMFINLAAFYLIGMPIACVLAFKFHLYAKGLWMGLICGLFAQSCSLFLITCLKPWRSITLPHISNEVSQLVE